MDSKNLETKALVESCLGLVPDGFNLVMLASHRAKELAAGIVPCIPRESSKDAVLSLKEIASETLDLDALKERAITGYQKFSFLSEDSHIEH